MQIEEAERLSLSAKESPKRGTTIEAKPPDLVSLMAFRRGLALRGTTLIVVTVGLVALGLLVMAVSYRHAVAAHQMVAQAHDRDKLAQRAEKYFWREQEAMNEYLLTPRPVILRELDALSVEYERALSELRLLATRQQAQLVLEAATAHRAFIREFQADRPAAGRGVIPEHQVAEQLKAMEPRVLAPLSMIGPTDDQEGRHESAVAKADARRALTAGILAALLAIGGGVVFAIYAVRLLRRIRAQNEQLRTFDKLKDDFVASVSHELRTPLTSIRGYLELLTSGEAGELNAEQERFLAVVDRNADRLLNVVGDLLFVSQVEAGVIALQRHPFELLPLLEESVEAARPAAEAKGLLLELSAECVADVEADHKRLAQVFDNLLSNAIKFTPPRGRVVVRILAEGDRARILFEDTGMGISAEDQEHLFARFFRTSTANELAIQGTGLGLAIVKAIVEGHGGKITVASELGRGTTFCVELPLAVGEVVAA
jgi:signal transduction histidine kinase